MNVRHFGRAQQMWVLIAACILLFALFLLLIPGMTGALWWRVMIAALVATGIAAAIFNVWLGRVLARREGTIQLLDRVTFGDLSLSSREILSATQSARMAAAMRALVSNLERTSRRFGQLATDVAKDSEQISSRSRVLAKSAGEQLAST